MLRTILGSYEKIEPARLRFCYSPYGKPYLAAENNHGNLRFNISHADAIALFAIARGRELGVDIERIRPHVADEGIAERFFSSKEVSCLRALPAALQTEAFFNCWTRKEAYIKARGEGLSLPLDKFDVSLAPGEQATLLETRIDPSEVSRWRLLELKPGSEFTAALAVEGRDWRLKCWRWSW